MKRGLLVVVGCVAAATLVVALPAAANNRPVTGERLGLFTTPATFPADTPFYTEHGFVCELADQDCMQVEISARSWFELYVDDELQPSSIDVDRGDNTIGKLSLTNFAAGLPAGNHVFVGKWYRNGELFSTATRTVTFTP